jgi:hypothetical protein
MPALAQRTTARMGPCFSGRSVAPVRRVPAGVRGAVQRRRVAQELATGGEAQESLSLPDLTNKRRDLELELNLAGGPALTGVCELQRCATA